MTSIYYGAIARKDTILAQYADVSGNFDVLSASILKKLHTKDVRFACEKEGHKFYIYHDEDNGINFIVVGSLSLQSDQAYECIDKIKRDFYQRLHKNDWENAKPYGLQNQFSSQIKTNILSFSRESKLSEIQNNLRETQKTMTDSMKSLVLRGRELEDLDEGAVSLEASSKNFERQALKIKREMWWQKYRWYVLAAIVIAAIILLIILICIMRKKN
ncbi:hypothetical protein M9Y10_017747 [Tritrichomonas musculus]|uniref:Synaptobrevin family protein n=1 Tax=Tritrichomonas musculus TaxID=1915356 RepID=A0ABR2HUG5_9EUKA